jgi:hypothetical protein
MKFTQSILLALASLSIVSCAQAASDGKLNTSASSAPSTPMQPIASSRTTIGSGTFVSGEHQTQGKVRIVTKGNKSFIQLDRSFKTSNMGPDLVVILHRSSDVLSTSKAPSYSLKAGDYIVISRLQKFSGSQSYLIPSRVDLAKYKSVVIWCRKFNATFGAASLSS